MWGSVNPDEVYELLTWRWSGLLCVFTCSMAPSSYRSGMFWSRFLQMRTSLRATLIPPPVRGCLMLYASPRRSTPANDRLLFVSHPKHMTSCCNPPISAKHSEWRVEDNFKCFSVLLFLMFWQFKPGGNVKVCQRSLLQQSALVLQQQHPHKNWIQTKSNLKGQFHILGNYVVSCLCTTYEAS